MAKLTIQQRQINNLQAYQTRQQEIYLREWKKMLGINIDRLSKKQYNKLTRQRNRLYQKQQRLKRRCQVSISG
jgi:hypothetical protein